MSAPISEDTKIMVVSATTDAAVEAQVPTDSAQSSTEAAERQPSTTNTGDSIQPTIPTTTVQAASSSIDNIQADKEVDDVHKGKQRDDGPALPAKEKGSDDAVMAIGPAEDEIRAPVAEPDGPPVCTITLLLTTGSRHPYKLDAKYLGLRNVAIPEQTAHGHPDPFSISIYTLKELILREWRSDWETKPASPSSIRLIHFGKLLDDKEPLKKYQFSAGSPNVVHMSIRPQDLDEEEPKSGGKTLPGGGADGGRPRGRGFCCVIL